MDRARRDVKARFINPDLYDQALTHRSWCHEHGGQDYERLEFLGDTILQYVVTDWIFRNYPDLAEGQLTELRQRLVEEPTLARLATDLGLADKARFGVGASADGTPARPRVLASLYEAMLGAVYLDRGIDAAREEVARAVLPLAENFRVALAGEGHKEGGRSPVSELQEWCQRRHHTVPLYEVLGESGPENAKEFYVRVRIDGDVEAEGKGVSKQAARADAATEALRALGLRP